MYYDLMFYTGGIELLHVHVQLCTEFLKLLPLIYMFFSCTRRMSVLFLSGCLSAFSALTLLAGRQEEHPA